jgi:hypothetical protein
MVKPSLIKGVEGVCSNKFEGFSKGRPPHRKNSIKLHKNSK